MDKSTAIAFCYSKAAGLLKKSFIKERTSLLFMQESLAGLWDLLFKEPAPLVPEVMLARQIEEKAAANFLSQYKNFMDMFDYPPEILTDKLRLFETDYSKQHESEEIHSQQSLDFKRDLQILKENWNAIEMCMGDDRAAHEKLFLDEYIIKNIIWALRLEIYYEMPREQIIQNLFYVTDKADKNDPVAGPAIKVLNFDVNNYSDWENWKYAQFLNPHESGERWRVDPVWIERKYAGHQAKLAESIFHQYTMQDAALAAWFKLKSYELTCIRTAVEGLRLNISSEEAMEAVGING